MSKAVVHRLALACAFAVLADATAPGGSLLVDRPPPPPRRDRPPPPPPPRPEGSVLLRTNENRIQPAPPERQQPPTATFKHANYGGIRPPPPLARGPPPIQNYAQQQNYAPRQPPQQPQILRQRPQYAATTPLWKTLWQRVEQSLDVLADMEDVVSDRATKLLSKPVTSLLPQNRRASPIPTVSISPNSNNNSNSNKNEPKTNTSQRPATRMQETTSSSQSAMPPRTFGDKFKVINKSTAAIRASSSTRRSVPWDQLQQTKTIIHTNGGASQPQTPRRENMFTSASPARPITNTGRNVAPLEQDDKPSSSLWSKIRLPSLSMTMPLSKFFGKGSSSFQRLSRETLEAWNEEEHVAHNHKKVVYTRQQALTTTTTPPIHDLLARSDHGKSSSLLSSQDVATCQSIGGSKAIWDMICLVFLLLATHSLLPILDTTMTTPSLAFLLKVTDTTWALHAICAALLTSLTNHVLFYQRIQSFATDVANVVKQETQYCQLYMRLVTSAPVQQYTQERFQSAAYSQVLGAVELARFKSFVNLCIVTLVLMTVSILRPIAVLIYGGLLNLISLQEWHSWPIAWSSLLEHVTGIVLPLGETLKALVMNEVHDVMHHPMKAAFQAATLASLLLVTLLPSMEQRRKAPMIVEDGDEDEESSLFGNVKTLSNLGISSASRLGLLSKSSGALEGTLERWRSSIPQPLASTTRYSSLSKLFRLFFYTFMSGVILAAPILVYFFSGISSKVATTATILQWDSVVDVSIVLLFTFGLAYRAISAVVDSSTLKSHVTTFVHNLAEIIEEVTSSNRPGVSKLGTSMSPVKGLSVKDLWTAHSTKRAWSVRGANLECPAGQVLVILGEDGSGKTRLLTSIAESLVFPPKRSLSNTLVRGTVAVGGLDASKWDRSELKKRLGLYLNDVRTIADNAEFLSGFTLEEILEPMNGIRGGQGTGTRERNAMKVALELTGLSTSLLPRLPSKLSTVVSANEDELTPSHTRPRCSPLSPSEWSKLLLARVLTQTIYDNDARSTENSLIGSLLLLDDVTSFMSEVDEARLFIALRQTGAATIITSHKWATGRLADQIVVMKEGAVLESGSHSELLSRGPQQSLYAQKWYAMTSSY